MNRVPIGTRTGNFNPTLDFHAGTGNLFAVIQDSDGSTHSWVVYLSTDLGKTWTETESFDSTDPWEDVTGVVLGDYFYVAYIATSVFPSRAYIQRFHAATGARDTSWGHYFLDAPSNIEEIQITSDADYRNQRLDCLTLETTGDIRSSYLFPSGGTPDWTTSAPLVTNALHTLDCVHTLDKLFFSYVSEMLGGFVFMGVADTSWIQVVIETTTGFADWEHGPVRISAYNHGEGDVAFLLHEFADGDNYGIRYRGTHDYFETAPEVGTIVTAGSYSHEAPDITMRNGRGIVAAYHRDAAWVDRGCMSWSDYSASSWSGSIIWDENQFTYVDNPLVVESVPNGFGVIHVYYTGRAYYEQLPLLFASSFELGHITGWSGSVP